MSVYYSVSSFERVSGLSMASLSLIVSTCGTESCSELESATVIGSETACSRLSAFGWHFASASSSGSQWATVSRLECQSSRQSRLVICFETLRASA